MARTAIAGGAGPAALTVSGAVALTGVSQMVGYGTVFYSYAIVAPHVAAAFGVAPSLPFTVISVALMLSGLAAPAIGRAIDRIGGPRIMCAGSVGVALIYAALAAAPSFWLAAALIVLLQVVAVTVLYSAAFPTLSRFGPRQGRRAITWLTLISGFASTIFWPLSGYLVAEAGWRGTFLIFALLHLLLALPAHLMLAARHIAPEIAPADVPPDAPAVPQPAAPPVPRRAAFWLMAVSFGASGVVGTAIMVHMVPILDRAGLGAQIYIASSLVGPAMVLVRLFEAVLWPAAHPLRSAIGAALCFPLALLVLLPDLPPLLAGSLFALLYGAGHGLGVIVAGTLPLRVFGAQGYAELLGRLGAVRLLLSAFAPAALALSFELAGFRPSLAVGAAIGLLGVAALLALGRLLSRSSQAVGDIP